MYLILLTQKIVSFIQNNQTDGVQILTTNK